MTGGGHHQNEWIRFSDREFIVEAFAWVFPSPTFALVNRLGARGWCPGSDAPVPQRHYLDAVPIATDAAGGPKLSPASSLRSYLLCPIKATLFCISFLC